MGGSKRPPGPSPEQRRLEAANVMALEDQESKLQEERDRVIGKRDPFGGLYNTALRYDSSASQTSWMRRSQGAAGGGTSTGTWSKG